MDKKFKKPDFKIPDGYLEDFNQRMRERLSQEEESPIPDLDGLRRGKGFRMPEGYLDGLNEKILDKVGSGKTKVIPLNPYKKYYYIAASIAAVILVFLGLRLNQTEVVSFDDLANSDIERYLEDKGLELTSYEIAEVIPVEELELNDILENQIEDESIMEYLDDTLDDVDELNIAIDEYEE